MKNLLFISTFLLLISFSTAQGQKSFMKYGKISKQELTMTTYPQDTSAGAVVLGEFGITRFELNADDGFYLSFTRHIRIKILKKSELDQADFTIYLAQGGGGDKEDLRMIKGITYNMENGSIEKYKLKNSDVYRNELNEDFKTVTFSMPNVKVGSVIDVSYNISSPFTFTLNPWYFQSDIPVRKSEYHVYIPEYYFYKNWTSGFVSINKESTVNTETYNFIKGAEITSRGRQSGGSYSIQAEVTHWTYTATNIPAFINEPYITTPRDYLSAVEFELVSTNFPGQIQKFYTNSWANINTELLDQENFGRQLTMNGHLKDIAATMAVVSDDPEARMQLAYEYIKNKMIWDNRYSRYPDISIRKAFNDKAGNSADINLNLVVLLRELGLTANPVLVSTRNNGKLRPGIVIKTQFNHVIAGVKIDDQMYMLDATDHYCPFYLLPPNTLSEKGLMVKEGGPAWVDLYSNIPHDNTHFINVSINDDLEIVGDYQQSQKNFKALSTRKSIKALTKTEDYAEEMEKAIEGLEIENLEIENLDSIYKPLMVSTQVTFHDRITDGGEMLYFNPVMVARWEENPFKDDDRKFPVDFNYPYKLNYTGIIKIPENFTIEELPESVMLRLPDNGGEFVYRIRAVGNQLMLTYSYKINQTIFPSMNYPEIKKFFELMVSKHAEQVVLKRS